MRINLIFPPQFEPFQPYLAGAVLQSALTKAGLSCRYHDLNLHYYRYLLQNAFTQALWTANSSLCPIDEYKASMRAMEGVLKDRRIMQHGIGFYDSTFGDSLYAGETLLEIAAGPWGRSFHQFLEQHWAESSGTEEPSLAGIILVVHDQLPAALVLSSFLKKLNPKTHICWGGPLVSRIGKQILEEQCLTPYFDSLVMGGGESVLPALAHSLSNAGTVPLLPGLFPSGIRAPEKMSLAPPSAEFLLPDFTGYPLSEYLSPDLVLPYLTSRGCYWGKCEFCCHYRPFDKYETTDVVRIVDQLEHLAGVHNVRHFSFSDEAIPVSILRRLGREICRRQLDIRWFTFARMESGFDLETCKSLHLAGCRVLMFGFESAVQRVLDAMQKGTRVEHVVPILRNCAEAGISIRLDVLVGFPTETHKESEATLEFLLANKSIIDTPFSVTPLSKFELQVDAPMQSYLTDFGVRSLGPLRGPLDYQHAYSVVSGMGPEAADKEYHRFIEVISKEFRAHARMPENKTHAFLMKCYYSNGAMEQAIFADEVTPANLAQYWFDGLDSTSLTESENGKWLLLNTRNGAQLRIGTALASIVNELKCTGRIAVSDTLDQTSQSKIAQFITYLSRQHFLNVHSEREAGHLSLIRV